MPMTDSVSASTVARAARLLAWLGVPVLAFLGLRIFDPLVLGTDPSTATAWLVPVAGALAAVVGAGAALVAVATAMRGEGSLARILDAAAAGALAAAAGTIALQGSAASRDAPQTVIGLGLLATAAPLVAASLVGPLPLRGVRTRTAAVVGVFAWVEIAPLLGLLLEAQLGSATVAITTVGSAVAAVAVAAAFASGNLGRVGWVGGLASGGAVLAAARPGTADVLPGLLALAAALTGMCLWLITARGDRELPEAPMAGAPVPALPAPPANELSAEVESLERELRSTIAELLAARQTISLQRDELEEMVQTDPATRVASRGAILDRLQAEAAEARRYAHPMALVLVHLDGLANLNRSRGLRIGDAVLAELALRLRARIRAADAIGRLTGDTFLAILPHTDERGATVFADAVRTRLIARPVQTNGGSVVMAVSIGITVVRPGADVSSDDELLGRCEEALTSARAAGENRIAFDRQHGLARLDERRAAAGPPGSEGDRADRAEFERDDQPA